MVDPLASFEVRNIIPIHIFGMDISITNSSLYMLLVVALICLVCSLGTRGKSLVPGKLQFCLEKLYLFITDTVNQQIRNKSAKMFPYIFSLFLFIMLGNIIGLIPGSFSFTSQLVITMGMAFVVWISSIIVGFVVQGKHFFRHFCPDGMPSYIAPFFVLVEIMSFCFRPVSLGIRLFANMLSGHIMIEVMASFAVSLAGIFMFDPASVIPVIANVFLNVFKLVVCVLQAYVFSVLSCIYMAESLEPATDKSKECEV